MKKKPTLDDIKTREIYTVNDLSILYILAMIGTITVGIILLFLLLNI